MPKTVRGHTCEGLQTHYKYAGKNYCIPIITSTGYIAGCDDTNKTRFNFCPYCGVRLEKGKGVKKLK